MRGRKSGFDESVIAVIPQTPHRGPLDFGRRRGVRQPEADEQRDHLDADTDIAFEPGGAPV